MPPARVACTGATRAPHPRHNSTAVFHPSALALRGRRARGVLVALMGCGLASLCVAAGSRTLDLVTFTPPPGWNVEEKGDGTARHVVMSRAGTASYCMVVLYASTPASSDLAASFAAEWKAVALQNIDPTPAPEPEMHAVGNARAAIGGATSTIKGQPVMGMLIVLDAGGSVMSMLVLSSSVEKFDAYNTEVQGLLASIAVRRVDAAVGAANPAPAAATTPVATDSYGRLIIPPPTRQLVIADLAGEWGRNDGINTTYVDRYSGAYAGTDSLHFTEEWTITAKGEISLNFYGIQNGRRIADKEKGVVGLSKEGILVIQMTNTQMYVVRGWLVTPTMTILKLNGPWYDSIPPEILSNPNQGANLDKNWVRLVKKE